MGEALRLSPMCSMISVQFVCIVPIFQKSLSGSALLQLELSDYSFSGIWISPCSDSYCLTCCLMI
nr:MAG TPA: hypothetical protein [Inoviridae sp.]